MRNSEFVIVDVETTGLSPRTGDRIVEIAAIRVKDLKPADRFYALVNPQRDISYGAFLVNRITREMLRDAPPACQVLPDFIQFVGRAVLVGHNVKFDLGFLTLELELSGCSWPADVVAWDTMMIARRLLPGLGSYSLWSVAHSLGMDVEQQHRAMADVELTFFVFRKLLKIAGRREIGDIRILAQ